MSQPTPLKEWLRRIAMMIVAPVALLALLEYVLWVFDIAPPPERPENPNRPALTTFNGEFDPEAMHNQLRHAPPGHRVICLGGSTMAGTPFEYEFSMCTLVAAALGPDTEMFNVAGSGADSVDILWLANTVCRPEHETTVLLVYSGHNEFLQLHRWVHGPPPEIVTATARFFERFRFYRLIQRLVRGDQPDRISEVGEADVTDDEVYARYAENMRQLADLCSDHHLILSTVISNPDFRFAQGGQTLRESFGRRPGARTVRYGVSCRHCFRAAPIINRTLREIGRTLSTPVIETTDIVEGRDGGDLFWDHVHAKPEVHVEIAERVLQRMKEEGWVDSYAPVRSPLTEQQLEWARVDRAMYNVKLDPAFALRQFREVGLDSMDIRGGLSMAIAGFLVDDDEAMSAGFEAARAGLEDRAEVRAVWESCAGLRGGVSQRRGSSCRLECMPWCSEALVSEAEHTELTRRADAVGNAVISAIIREF